MYMFPAIKLIHSNHSVFLLYLIQSDSCRVQKHTTLRTSNESRMSDYKFVSIRITHRYQTLITSMFLSRIEFLVPRLIQILETIVRVCNMIKSLYLSTHIFIHLHISSFTLPHAAPFLFILTHRRASIINFGYLEMKNSWMKNARHRSFNNRASFPVKTNVHRNTGHQLKSGDATT